MYNHIQLAIGNFKFSIPARVLTKVELMDSRSFLGEMSSNTPELFLTIDPNHRVTL